MAQENQGCGAQIGIIFLLIIIVYYVRQWSSAPVQQAPVYVPVPQQSPPLINPYNSPQTQYGMNGGVKCSTNQDPITGEISTTCNPN